MIGFLRFVGILNAAAWFGAAVFFTFAASRAISSEEMKTLLTAKHYPYFSVAIAQILAARYFQTQIVCGMIALSHMLAEWLYSGKVPRKFWRGLLLGLVAANLLSGLCIEPMLKKWHQAAYTLNTGLETQKSALRSFRTWQSASEVVNLLVVGSLAVYLWRVVNPPDTTRFVSTTKFRS